MFRISVVIPVKNGAQTLHRCLQSLHEQTIADNIQVIVLDSMSTDGSREIARNYSAEVIDIPDGTFDHGLTRNIGVQQAKANLVYFTVQDARIAEANMLEKMVGHFTNEQIMAVGGHQAVPHEKDKNPVLWRKTFSIPQLKTKELSNPALFDTLSAAEQKSLLAWDNVVAMYRKTALLQQPFVQTNFAEDWIWSYQALLKGWRLLYDPSLVVYHYHHSTYSYTFSVNYTLNYHFYRYFHFLPSMPPLVRPLVERSYHLMKNKDLTFKEKLFWTFHNAGIVTANKLSVLNFLARLKTGGMKSIERGFEKYCSEIPQGKQKKQLV